MRNTALWNVKKQKIKRKTSNWPTTPQKEKKLINSSVLTNKNCHLQSSQLFFSYNFAENPC